MANERQEENFAQNVDDKARRATEELPNKLDVWAWSLPKRASKS
jgi:hypothetical protein